MKHPAGKFSPSHSSFVVLYSILAGILLCSSSQAAVILSDNFNYPDGTITNAAGALWSEHSGGGANQEVLVNGGQVQLTFSRSEDVDATLTNAPYTPVSGAVLVTS